MLFLSFWLRYTLINQCVIVRPLNNQFRGMAGLLLRYKGHQVYPDIIDNGTYLTGHQLPDPL